MDPMILDPPHLVATPTPPTVSGWPPFRAWQIDHALVHDPARAARVAIRWRDRDLEAIFAPFRWLFRWLSDLFHDVVAMAHPAIEWVVQVGRDLGLIPEGVTHAG